MFAIIQIGGHQYKIEEGMSLYVNRLDEKEGKKIVFNDVLLLDNSGKVQVGTPILKDVLVEAKIIKHLKADKVIVFKKKRRKGYRVKNGHRQPITEIKVDHIKTASASKKSVTVATA